MILARAVIYVRESCSACSQAAFSLPGFLLVAAACVFSALRWVLIQKLVHCSGTAALGRPTPTSTILQCSPSAIATTVPLVLWFEAQALVDDPLLRESELRRELGSYLVLVSGLLFLLMYSEYALVQLTSSLTLSVAGIFKELMCIIGAIVLFEVWRLPASRIAGHRPNCTPLPAAGHVHAA